MSTRHNDRNPSNKVKRLSGAHPKLELCPRLPRILGLSDIRNSFGRDALLITKGSFIYNVNQFPELYQEGI